MAASCPAVAEACLAVPASVVPASSRSASGRVVAQKVGLPVNSLFLRAHRAVACIVSPGRLAASAASAGRGVVRPCAGHFQVLFPEPDRDSQLAMVELELLAALRALLEPPLPDVPQASLLLEPLAAPDVLALADLLSLADVSV